jgi:hypothetical protein
MTRHRSVDRACKALGKAADLGGELGPVKHFEVDTDRFDTDRKAAEPVSKPR